MARVLQVITELVVGGATLTMLDFAEDLSSEHELHLAHGRLVDPENAAAVRARERFATHELPQLVRPLSAREDGAAVREFRTLVSALRPDVIHTHSSKAGFVGRIGALTGGVSALQAAATGVGRQTHPILLHTIHGWGHTPIDGDVHRNALILVERLAARGTDRLIAVSEEVRAEGLALRIGRPGQYTVIGAPVDMRPTDPDFRRGRAAARARLDLPVDADVVGWVGRFSPQKDPRTLAEVVSKLLSERPNVYAVLVGDGPDRETVGGRLAAEISARRVLIPGRRDDVRALYPAFDVVVHPSLWEGHPRVVREALAERVPVVCARVSGTQVIGEDERLGAWVEPSDITAFVAELSRILDSGDLRAPIDEEALVSVREGADEPYLLMRELYRSVLAQDRE
jgi:glycosyltransferase involved in cell wall biosynthesis